MQQQHHQHQLLQYKENLHLLKNRLQFCNHQHRHRLRLQGNHQHRHLRQLSIQLLV
jgi:hypothetical protein